MSNIETVKTRSWLVPALATVFAVPMLLIPELVIVPYIGLSFAGGVFLLWRKHSLAGAPTS